MSAIVHLLLAVVLTLFLAIQAGSLLVVLRHRRVATAAARGRADFVWTCIPVAIVLFLAARSWVAVFGLAQPQAASAVTQVAPETAAGGSHMTKQWTMRP
ncbi:MAG: hypothetical protein C5B48_14525 [Candidatus Rokuibacteriota bacterium]|nr:MAG: hypothetical protein C5B48_14525 [Candidatus Rokubacteria bacterium]